MLKNNYQGLTMLELLMSVIIFAILSIIAVTSYRTYITKSYRSEAINTLLSMQLAQEDYRTKNTSYGNLTQVWGGVSSTSSGKYSLAITGTSTTGYTITATAQGSQTSDSENGTSCSSLVLTVSNGTMTKTPAVCWSF